jgi:hypothetical protein
MGGFLAALGGFGQGVGHYGEQMRGILESRRHDLAATIGQMHATESDPNTALALMKIQTGLHAGDPIGKLTVDFNNLMQKRQKDMDALQSVIGNGPPPPAKPAPGPTPIGSPAGQGGNMLAPLPQMPQMDQTPVNALPPIGQASAPWFPPQAAPAAQAAASPVQGGSSPQGSSAPPPQLPAAMPPPAEPHYRSRADIYNSMYHDPRYTAPANRRWMEANAEHESQISDQFQHEQDLRTYDRSQRDAVFAEVKASPDFAALPAQTRLQWKAWVVSGGAPPTIAPSLFTPFNTPGIVPLNEVDPKDRVDRDGKPLDPSVTAGRKQTDKLTNKSWFVPSFGPTVTGAGPNGLEAVSRLPGPLTASDGSPLLPSAGATPKTVTLADGTTGFQTAAGANAGKAPVATGGVNPAMQTTQRGTVQTLDAEGNTHTTSTSRKVAPGPGSAIAPVGAGTPRSGAGAPPLKPVSAAPAPSKAGATGSLPPRTPLYNPSNRIDNLVRLIGQDAGNEKLIASRQDRIAVGQRMSDLGIDPNNATGSMRERAANARLVLGHLDDVNHIIDEADKAGELGILASRWNDFLANKVGQDTTKSQVFSKLSSNLHFLSTAIAMAHGGVRAGGSPTMVEHWQEALSGKDPATIKQKLAQAHKWMEGYASLVPTKSDDIMNTDVIDVVKGPDGKLRFKSSGTTPAPAPPSPAAAPKAAAPAGPPASVTSGLPEGGRVQGPDGSVWTKRKGAMVRE